MNLATFHCSSYVACMVEIQLWAINSFNLAEDGNDDKVKCIRQER